MRISISDWAAIEPVPSESKSHPTKLRSTVAFSVDGEAVEVVTERNGKPVPEGRQFADLPLTVTQADALAAILGNREAFRAAIEAGEIVLPGASNLRGKPPVRGTSLLDLMAAADAEVEAELEAAKVAKAAAKAAAKSAK